MSDENKIEVKYGMYINGMKWYVSKEGLLLNEFGGTVFCMNCVNENGLNTHVDEDQLLKMGAYFKEYEERAVQCQCCGRIEIDNHLIHERDLERLTRKKLII
ncbi:hypothetical protein [Methanobrevibacter sp.]|uniref:hypothetical protein n=1 Tax=Methanobrevibacter sp. TaxID=66852 RepID=UPI00386CCCE0